MVPPAARVYRFPNAASTGFPLENGMAIRPADSTALSSPLLLTVPLLFRLLVPAAVTL